MLDYFFWKDNWGPQRKGSLQRIFTEWHREMRTLWWAHGR